MNYNEAVEKIALNLEAIKSNEGNLDDLMDKAKETLKLIKSCEARLKDAEKELEDLWE